MGVLTTYSFGTLSACLITVTHLIQLKTFELKSLCVFYMECCLSYFLVGIDQSFLFRLDCYDTAVGYFSFKCLALVQSALRGGGIEQNNNFFLS